MAQSPHPEGGAARPPSPGGAPLGRCIALVCHSWGHASTFFSWTWTKQYLLRRLPDGGLDPSEQLFIVKAGKDDVKDDRWKVGGPLVPDLDTALARYSHSVVVLEGGVKSNIAAWLAQQHVDVLVMPDQWPQNMLQKGLQFASVSDWAKANLHCPFVIIRRHAVVNARMKISSQSKSPSSPEAMLSRVSAPTAAATGRRICIAYNSFAEGRGLLAFARDRVLTPRDTVYIAHVFSKDQHAVIKEMMKVTRVLTMQRAESGPAEVTRDNHLDFGAAELEGFPNLQLGVALQGDPKHALASFCDSEDIELLILGTRSAGKIRKKLSGGGVSSHLIDNAPCPCLVVPYHYIGLHVEEGRDTADEEIGVESPSSAPFLGAGGSPAAGREVGVQTEGAAAAVTATVAAGAEHSSPSDLLAQLQRQIEEKDRVIAELRQQVQQLQLAAAQGKQSAAQDPAHSTLTL